MAMTTTGDNNDDDNNFTMESLIHRILTELRTLVLTFPSYVLLY